MGSIHKLSAIGNNEYRNIYTIILFRINHKLVRGAIILFKFSGINHLTFWKCPQKKLLTS